MKKKPVFMYIEMPLPQFRKTMLGAVLPESIVKALYARASHKKNYRKLTSCYRRSLSNT